MSRSPQDTYARHLLSSRGYPLWIPEPSHQLLLYRQDGLRIGDVGVVVPEDGGFEVFFNICLPREHPFHRAVGVPDSFKRIELRDEDIRVIPNVENPGRTISSSSVTRVRAVEPHSDTSSARSNGLRYEFDLSSSGGALLILPEGATRYDLQNRRLFFDEASKHGVDWYRFAEEQLGRMISHDSLYLITGFYKTRSWSLASFESVLGNGEFSAQFKSAQVGGGNIAGTYTWETTRALDWRVGPVENYGIPNQSVFIRGFKIALRTDLLGKTKVYVKAGAPSTHSEYEGLPSVVKHGTWLSRAWKTISRGGRSGSDTRVEDTVGPTTNQAGDHPGSGVPDHLGKHVVVELMPEVPQNFHPSDIINQYLLRNGTSANIAITHDDDWIAVLEKGQLKLEDLVQDNPFKAEEVVSNAFDIVLHEGVASLQEKRDESESDDNERAIADESLLLSPSGGCVSSHSDRNPRTADQPPAFPEIEIKKIQDTQHCDSPSEANHPLPEYKPESADGSLSINTGKKLYPLFDSPRVPESPTDPLGIHWLLLPYDPRRSRHLLRFDIILSVDQICYQRGNNVREKLTDEQLDKPASIRDPVTNMTIIFDQWPFSWTIEVDNPNGIRCRDVFKAIYDGFNQQLTVGELWRVPDRRACEEAFRLRNIVLGSPPIEQSLGWKRVDVLLHHTIFHGLTMSPKGEWVLNLGAPLPVSGLACYCRGSSSPEGSAEGSEDSSGRTFFHEPRPSTPVYNPTPPRTHSHSSFWPVGELGNIEGSATQAFPSIISSVVPPQQSIIRPRPFRRPLGPRAPPKRRLNIDD